MLRQVNLLPSGCQEASANSILHFSERRIIYASSLAVYVLNAKTFAVEKILSSNQRAITCLALSPVHSNLLAVSSQDNSVTVWDIDDEAIVSRSTMTCATFASWDYASAEYVTLLALDSVRLFSWKVAQPKDSKVALEEAFKVRSSELKPQLMRWNRKVTGLVAIGCNAGTVFLFSRGDGSHRVISSPQIVDRKAASATVVDLQWDPLSTAYLLVAYSSHLELWDADASQPIPSLIVSFDKQPLPITAIAWMDWTAGNFLSINGRSQVLKVWNASQKNTLETIRMPRHTTTDGDNSHSSSNEGGGISAIFFCAAHRQALLACSNGSLAVLDLSQTQSQSSSSSTHQIQSQSLPPLLFRSAANHTETIFSCAFHPNHAYCFATGSYDSTVKLWTCPDLALTRTINSGGEGIIYAVAWSPDGHMIAAALNNGLIAIWETESGIELARYFLHTKAVYNISWCSLDDGRSLLSTSGDGSAIVSELNLDSLRDPYYANIATGSRRKGAAGLKEQISQVSKKKAFAHPAAVYGCAWHPHQASVFATCCQDGIVRIFNHLLANGQLLYSLKGHTARAFGVEWSLLMPGVLATGSDDHSVIVWDLNTPNKGATASIAASSPVTISPKQRLSGHTNYVRALCWSHEIPCLLLSGSWDCSIRLWDSIRGTCLSVIRDHTADVYSIVSHPSRPFAFLSCSRDTTLRVWELGGNSMGLFRGYASWDGAFDRLIPNSSTQGDSTDVGSNNSDNSLIQQRRQQFVSLCNSNSDYNNDNNNNGKSGDDDSYGKDRSKSREALANPPNINSKIRADTILPLALGGKESRMLFALSTSSSFQRRSLQTSDGLELAAAYYKLFSFFNGSTSGMMDLWEMAIDCLEQRKKRSGNANNTKTGTSKTSFFQAIASSSGNLLRPAHLRQVMHEEESSAQAKLEARKLAAGRLSSSAMPGSTGRKIMDLGGPTAEDNMLTAAMAYARLGDFGKYCALMVELGRWEAALAMAPAVSLDYWRSLSTRYAQHLQQGQQQQSGQSDACVPHLLAVGRDADAVDYYLSHQQFSLAMTVAKTSESRTDLIPDLSAAPLSTGLESGAQNDNSRLVSSLGGAVAASSPKRQLSISRPPSLMHSLSATHIELAFSAEASPSSPSRMVSDNINYHASSNVNTAQRERTEREVDESRALVKSVAMQAMRQKMSVGQPLAAAAHLLSVDDANAARDLLVIHHELDCAYALSLCFKLDASHLLVAWADQVASQGAVDLALEMLLQNHQDGDHEASLLIAKHCGDVNQATSLIQAHSLPLSADLIARATEAEAIGSDADATADYLKALQNERAAVAALHGLEGMVRGDAYEKISVNKKLLKVAKCIRLNSFPDNSGLKLRFLTHLLWITAHEAALAGCFHTAADMLGVLLDQLLIGPPQQPLFPLSAEEVKHELLFFLVLSGDSSAVKIVNSFLAPNDFPTGTVRDGLRALQALLREDRIWRGWVDRMGDRAVKAATAIAVRNSVNGNVSYNGAAGPDAELALNLLSSILT